jgi:DnaJ-class molecular chaperone
MTEDWIAPNGLVLNKTLNVRIVCWLCHGKGEIEAKSFPSRYPVQVACPVCGGLGHVNAKVFLKKVPGRDMNAAHENARA